MLFLTVGFSGAAAAVLIGVNPIIGLLTFTSGGGIAMGILGRKASSRDVQTGTILAFMLGLGVLFISMYDGYASEAYSILFGQILGISYSDVLLTLIIGIVVLVAVFVVYRPLLFSSLDEDVAEAKGLPMLAMNITFMLMVAIAVSIAVQVVGVLLIFALMVTPAAIAQKLTRTARSGIIASVLIALAAYVVRVIHRILYTIPCELHDNRDRLCGICNNFDRPEAHKESKTGA